MDWTKQIKQNWRLVVTIVIGLAILLGAAGFLFASYRGAKLVMEQLAQQSQELDRLSRLNPHPGNERVDNIKAALEQEEQIKKLIEQARSLFVPIEYPTNLTSPEFRLYLDKTLAELRRLARQAGVQIADGFAFGFEDIRNLMSFDQKNIPMLSRQVAEVSAICRLLFNAKVLSIDRVKRSAVSGQTNDSSGATFGFGGSGTGAGAQSPAFAPTPMTDTNLWDRQPITNELAILTPYEFTFHCFTPELQSFLNEVANSKYGLLIKTLAIDPTPSVLLQSTLGGIVGPVDSHAGLSRLDPTLASRYGLQPGEVAGGIGFGYGPRRVGDQVVVLEERPFRVRTWIYVARLLTPEEAAAVKAQRPVAPVGSTGYRYPSGGGYGFPYERGLPVQQTPTTPPGLIEHR